MTPLGDRAWDLLVLAALVGGAALYACGAARMSHHLGAARVLPRQAIAYGAGLAAAAIALSSPLARAGDALRAAHVAQHELLMLVAAPLLVLARPAAPALWALPRRWRVRARRAARRPAIAGAWRVATRPAIALGLHVAARWLWQVPAADEGGALHALPHAALLGTAALCWWALLHGRRGRAGRAAIAAWLGRSPPRRRAGGGAAVTPS